MSLPIDFYFDFTSPYAYLMSEKIDDLAARHGRQVNWRPFLLGVAFQASGASAFTRNSPKAPYLLRDFDRSARFLGVPYTLPANFPLGTQNAARAYYWLQDHRPERARAFAHAVFRALFVAGRDISLPAEVIALVDDGDGGLGGDGEALAAALTGQALKERLRAECAAAIVRGVFGAPFVFIDDEPFFGVDRLPQIERWLTGGGF
ncbi:MAG TPA: 2-hydroxychromene-2-carboxylate isomerase [Accumulibacter sp.]|nr:2-hydroxychromene-2-carboxylate isomerase [Accumulibacter sp.]HMW19150.1 2-hydroxychromene-2-carboxylate isomerase [Accumulibacter sp.]HMX22070.1 2-hydroxychromene-2-carboxylate isomerase [Accumulibacter sp.]HNC18566.1 2-hydroxychromene-2-carboxylate isomerase [Accumulibacter sp.]HNI73927.1 2-hydroxychromene-2-carboxylate isomerase [Accumulibacter sp.]